MTILKAIILGIIQGLTEFLPVSSSGHLTVAQHLLNVPEERILFFTVILHIGTLFSVFFVYSDDLINLIKEFFLVIFEVLTGKGLKLNNEYRKLGLLIILATIPTGLMGILFKDIFSSFYRSQLIIGISLIITGTLLWLAERMHSGKKDLRQMRWYDAIFIGIFQGFAITPGISRSGSTIVGSLFRGFNKRLATRFSFLISIPSILGATILETRVALTAGLGEFTFPILMVGILASFLSGVFAIRTLINFINKEKLYYFSFYTWAVGAIVVIMSII
ncbi:undecaprenyl-diphosphatase UppP [Serpentinicella alkaliphila]|uniref:Undecaprenyl-diphosphatase n=1 Tax=Serpentinicella alkaliphila TaxID=1734049 RepID=A0A4R2TAA8_9FIRM|nr:undecaprenyl-diphosphatase UppP [Serpentinicella alkaliphila]QUH25504.1 undecaprenyl-diphosphatase UppP [Serpentinicella alkaliphila]TCP99690.1 undecaprenyl-diphosphatase [Serpentinicella alkaliphila]